MPLQIFVLEIRASHIPPKSWPCLVGIKFQGENCLCFKKNYLVEGMVRDETLRAEAANSEH